MAAKGTERMGVNMGAPIANVGILLVPDAAGRPAARGYTASASLGVGLGLLPIEPGANGAFDRPIVTYDLTADQAARIEKALLLTPDRRFLRETLLRIESWPPFSTLGLT